MHVRPLDTLLAIKVLSTGAGLNGNDVRVAATLLEHYNRKTGQCDPGLKRIAGVLSISTRTVIRANQKLEGAGLFRKMRHGGHGNRNSYEPNWSRFAELEAAWRAKLKREAQLRTTNVSPATGQHCQLGNDTAVTQTYIINNLPKETFSKRPSKEENKHGRFVERQLNSTLGKRSADAARDEAERRWTTAVQRRFVASPITYGEIVNAIDEAMRSAATDAELARRGAGLGYILRRLKLGDGR